MATLKFPPDLVRKVVLIDEYEVEKYLLHETTPKQIQEFIEPHFDIPLNVYVTECREGMTKHLTVNNLKKL